ncbi:hypothetical protein CRYUN_Cryun28dG0093400 [Craigia yunnanensis]
MKKNSPNILEFDDEDGPEMFNIEEKTPNIFDSDNEDGLRLETILEVPIPEEMFRFRGLDTTNDKATLWHNLRYFSDINIMSYYLMKPQAYESTLDREFFALMKLVGSPFMPIVQPQTDHLPTWTIENSSFEVAKAKYILHQYIAASGGQAALNSVKSMYVVGQLKMLGPEEAHQADDRMHIKGNYEAGSFVLCQQNPNSWYLQMVMHGFEFNAGSDGSVSWYQSYWQPHRVDKGPPKPLRRLFQGLDPRFTANLFSNAASAGEKKVTNQDCFILKLQIPPTTLKMQSSSNTDIINYSIWGYFSQKTGLLIQLTDVILLRTRVNEENDDAFWAIRIESQMDDYRKIDCINIAHAGKTYARLDKYGDNDNGRWQIEEKWKIEEVDFNIHGLSMENFLPPSY